jgi:hypothetical protein
MAEFEERLKRIPHPRIKQPDSSYATHLMAAETDEEGNWFAFPTVQPDATGKLAAMRLRAAQSKAMRDKNYKAFGKDAGAALSYAEGEYKKDTVIDSFENRQRMLAQLMRGERYR